MFNCYENYQCFYLPWVGMIVGRNVDGAKVGTIEDVANIVEGKWVVKSVLNVLNIVVDWEYDELSAVDWIVVEIKDEVLVLIKVVVFVVGTNDEDDIIDTCVELCWVLVVGRVEVPVVIQINLQNTYLVNIYLWLSLKLRKSLL